MATGKHNPKKSTRYTGIAVCLVVALLWGCSKPDPVVPVIPPTPPPVTPSPTGYIQNFQITDTLVAFAYGSTLKWLVNGTNNYTVVTINGVKVGLYGVLDTGPLKANTKYTLSVNSGKDSSVSIKVADSLSTALWNGGKSLKISKAELFDPVKNVFDTTSIDPELLLQHIYFNFNGTTTIIRKSGGLTSVTDAGPFTTSAGTRFMWRGISYSIESLSDLKLVARFQELQSGGVVLTRRYTWTYE